MRDNAITQREREFENTKCQRENRKKREITILCAKKNITAIFFGTHFIGNPKKDLRWTLRSLRSLF
jgi:hypothetical protein